MTKFPEITNELTLERSAEALREQIGPRKAYSYEDVSAAVDVDDRTVESWVLGRSAPGLYNWLKLAGLFGGEFANRYLRLVGIDGAARINSAKVSDAEMNASAAQLVAALSDALQDLRVDHTEKPDIVKIARGTHEKLAGWLAEQDAPHTTARH